jgi:cytochrome c-type biogenesis protein CcmH
MRAWRNALIALACWGAVAAVHPALAVQPDEVLGDAALEARARGLSRELRCMVCQNQSIDDSDAPLARDLRLLVRERLTAGDSDAQVQDFLVARYGAFVLLKPPFEWYTAMLWLTPAAACWPAPSPCSSRFAAAVSASQDRRRSAPGRAAARRDDGQKLVKRALRTPRCD